VKAETVADIQGAADYVFSFGDDFVGGTATKTIATTFVSSEQAIAL